LFQHLACLASANAFEKETMNYQHILNWKYDWASKVFLLKCKQWKLCYNDKKYIWNSVTLISFRVLLQMYSSKHLARVRSVAKMQWLQVYVICFLSHP